MSKRRKTDDTLKFVLILLAIIALGPMLMMIAFPFMGLWGGGMMGGYGGYGMYGGSSVWGIAMSVVWLIVLVIGGYLVYRWLSGSGSIGSDRALEELRVAYARGELTEEEYEQRRSKLETE